MGKEKDSVHWPGLPFHAWPRTRRGLRILKWYLAFQVVTKLHLPRKEDSVTVCWCLALKSNYVGPQCPPVRGSMKIRGGPGFSCIVVIV